MNYIDYETKIKLKDEYEYQTHFPYFFVNSHDRVFILRHSINGEKDNRHFRLTKGYYCLYIKTSKRNKSGLSISIEEVNKISEVRLFTSNELLKEMKY